MNCLRCQMDNPSAARFCLNCGAALIQRCPNCQTGLPGGSRFCMHCGQSVNIGTPDDDARLTRLAAAAPAPLADKVRAAVHLEGERRLPEHLEEDLLVQHAAHDEVPLRGR